MRIVTFASGSTGNCGLISDGGANILVDAGISMSRIVKGLAELGLTPRDMCGVLITHEHSDHVSGLKMLVKHHGVKVMAPTQLCRVLAEKIPEISQSLCPIPLDEEFLIGNTLIKSFCTPHDAQFSVGYRFEGDAVFALATDTGCISAEMLEGLLGADVVLIEANHDEEILRSGPYPYYLKQRILARTGHLSNKDCGKLALMLANHGTRHIILGHLSRENNTPELAFAEVNAALSGTNTQLSVAPANKMLAVTVGDDVKCSV